MTGTVTRPPRPPRPARTARTAQDDGAPDPRMLRRRQQVQFQARRRRTKAVAAVLAAVALTLGVVLLTRSPALDVDRIVVGGADRVGRDTVIEASGVSTGDALVDLDRARIRERLMATPGIASARVDITWPDTVRIAVTEEQEFVVVSTPAGSVVVARGGRVLETADATPGATADTTADTTDDTTGDTMPVLTVEGGPAVDLRPGSAVPPAVRDALVVLEQVPASLEEELARATMTADGSLTFALDDGGSVHFGPPEEVPAKLLATATALGGRIDRACLDVLDVLEPTRPTISRRDGCVVAPPTVGAPTTTTPRGGASTSTSTPRRTGSGAPSTTAAAGGR